MTRVEAILGEIRLKSSTPTFSGTDFVCQKMCVKTGRSLVIPVQLDSLPGRIGRLAVVGMDCAISRID
jgi:hypothetical protein